MFGVIFDGVVGVGVGAGVDGKVGAGLSFIALPPDPPHAVSVRVKTNAKYHFILIVHFMFKKTFYVIDFNLAIPEKK